jgi:hypothetical protein
MRIRALLIALTSVAAAAPAWAGGGLARVQPGAISEGAQVQATTVTYVVPTGGFSAGGGIQVQLPFGWGPFPQTTNSTGFGYVTALTVPSQTVVITPSNSDASVSIFLGGGQSLAAGSTIQLTIQNLWTNCPPPGQTSVGWQISDRASGAVSLQALTAQPSQAIITGPARNIGFQPWDMLTTLRNQASSAITLQGRSWCGNPAPVSSSVVVSLSGYGSDYFTPDSSATFSSASSFATTITSVTIASGTLQAVFYYKTASFGNNLSIRASFNDLQGSSPTYITRSVNVLNSAVTFSNLSVDDGRTTTTQTTYALTPDNDGTNDFAFIRFFPSDPNAQWHVTISSDGFSTIVFERYGMGEPGGTVQWDGHRNRE